METPSHSYYIVFAAARVKKEEKYIFLFECFSRKRHSSGRAKGITIAYTVTFLISFITG
jgi:hypothetical protein